MDPFQRRMRARDSVTDAIAEGIVPLSAGAGLNVSRYTFSDGLLTPWGVWTSGQTASEFDPEIGKVVVRGSALQQTQTVFRKLGHVVAGAGLGLSDVGHVAEYVPVASAACRQDIERARHDLLGRGRPVVSTCVVQGLLRPGAHLEVEVEAIARPPMATRMPHVLATLLPVADDGSVVAPGNPRSQAEWCLERAAEELAADDLQLAGAVLTCQAQALDEAIAACGDLPISCRGVSDIGVAGADVSIDCVGAPSGTVAGVAMAATVAVASATKIGDLIYVYGLRCADPGTHQGTVDQAGCAYSALHQWLSAAWPDAVILKTVEAVTLAGLPDYRNVAGVRRRFLQQPWPVSSGLVYSSLRQPGGKFQVDAVIATPHE